MPRLLASSAALLAAAAITSIAAAQSTAGSDTLPISASVQDTTRLSTDSLRLAGSRIRATRRDGTRFFATVRAVRGDTLVLREHSADGLPIQVPASGLSRLEVARVRRAAWTNAQIGGAIGAIAAGVAYLNLCDKHPNLCRAREQTYYDSTGRCEQDQFELGSTMVLAGALVGGAIGYALTPSSWRRVGVSVAATVTPTGEGGAQASLGASVPFAALAGRR